MRKDQFIKNQNNNNNEEQDFVSLYHNEEKEEEESILLISKLDAKEYICYGHCTCDGEIIDHDYNINNNRRLIHPMKFLLYGTIVTAILCTAAYQYSAHYEMKYRCQRENQGKCPSGDENIDGEVKECVPLITDQEEGLNEEVEVEEKYICQGNCVPKEEESGYFCNQEVSNGVISSRFGNEGKHVEEEFRNVVHSKFCEMTGECDGGISLDENIICVQV